MTAAPRSAATSRGLWLASLAGIWMIVRRSLRQHALSTTVTVASVALGCGLIMAVFNVSRQSRDAFAGGEIGFDAVLGARGSQLQLVLNTVFHLETSPGNISWQTYLDVQRHPLVDLAIPYAVGDSFRGFRIVGTSTEIFTEFEYRKGRKLRPRDGGRPFEEDRQEAVIGATVARRTGLREGAVLQPSHGVGMDDHARHRQEYVVVGVLEQTNSPSDRVIWIPIEGMFRLDGHVLRGDGEEFHYEGEAIPDRHKEVSAVMLKFASMGAGLRLSREINFEGTEATLAWPIGRVMLELFDKMGWVAKILELVAYLVVVVAAGSILASIYNSMNERRREFAILRSLGARRRTVFAAIVLEAGTIAALGSVIGYAVYAGILLATRVIVQRETGVVIDLTAWHPALVGAPLGMIAVGVVSGLFPAFKAYATDVATNLVPTS